MPAILQLVLGDPRLNRQPTRGVTGEKVGAPSYESQIEVGF